MNRGGPIGEIRNNGVAIDIAEVVAVLRGVKLVRHRGVPDMNVEIDF